MKIESIQTLLATGYGLDCLDIKKSGVGAGSDTYVATCDQGGFVLKFPSITGINHPEIEPTLCAYLREHGLPVSEFIRNKSGSFISKDIEGRAFHVQRFVEGKAYPLNAAPSWLIRESAQMLGRIHSALRGYRGLEEGIGKSFFEHMTPRNAALSYERSLAIARTNGDADIERDLLFRLECVKRFEEDSFDLSRLTRQATHGDYFLSQLICGENAINAVIDWTSACVHPVIWEILRSYVYAAPECARGEIDEECLREYIDTYREFAPLNEYDLTNMKRLFAYQLAVCDYYGQFYASKADNREIYLHQARFSTGLLRNAFSRLL